LPLPYSGERSAKVDSSGSRSTSGSYMIS
jgi:hypothetical protein